MRAGCFRALFAVTLAMTGHPAYAQGDNARPLIPVSLERAVYEFNRVCLITMPSDRKLIRLMSGPFSIYHPETSGPGQSWRSSQARISFTPRGPKQCDLDSVLNAAPASRNDVAREIEARIGVFIGTKPPPRNVYTDHMTWEWEEKGVVRRIIYYFMPNIPARQLALSLQIL